MNFSRILNILLLLIGGFVAVYAQAREAQNQYLLIGGIFILMIGVYRISKNIPSKYEDDDIHTKDDDEF